MQTGCTISLIVMALHLLTRIQAPIAFRFVILSLLALIFGLPAIFAAISFMVTSERRRTTVTASSTGLVIEQPQGPKMKTTAIPARDLLDLDCSTIDGVAASARRSMNVSGAQDRNDERIVRLLKRLVPNAGIIVKSRSSVTRIGEGLSAEEIRYLIWSLQKALTSLPPQA
jgi:hypothetical protein